MNQRPLRGPETEIAPLALLAEYKLHMAAEHGAHRPRRRAQSGAVSCRISPTSSRLQHRPADSPRRGAHGHSAHQPRHRAHAPRRGQHNVHDRPGNSWQRRGLTATRASQVHWTFTAPFSAPGDRPPPQGFSPLLLMHRLLGLDPAQVAISFAARRLAASGYPDGQFEAGASSSSGAPGRGWCRTPGRCGRSPASPRAAESPYPPAALAEIVRIYGLRHWVEQSYKQVKDELGWADFQVRSDTAIRRHQTLVNCAFSFCWNTWFAPPPPTPADPPPGPDPPPDPLERGRTDVPAAPTGLLAPGAAGRPWLADALVHAATLLAGMVDEAPARSTPRTDQHRRQRQTP